MLVDWIASPHFFAKDRIIVLVLGDDAALVHALTRIRGPTLSPRALPGTRVKSPCERP
jgi:hypothetical protein